MLSTESNASVPLRIEIWEIARFVPYARNPRKNDHAVERMAAPSGSSGSGCRFSPEAPAMSSTDIFG